MGICLTQSEVGDLLHTPVIITVTVLPSRTDTHTTYTVRLVREDIRKSVVRIHGLRHRYLPRPNKNGVLPYGLTVTTSHYIRKEVRSHSRSHPVRSPRDLNVRPHITGSTTFPILTTVIVIGGFPSTFRYPSRSKPRKTGHPSKRSRNVTDNRPYNL